MARTNRSWASYGPFVLAMGLLALLGGCVGVAKGGSGPGGYYFTSTGVGSVVKGSVDNIASRAQAVLEEEGVAITETKTEDSGDKRFFKGTKGDLDVSVTIERKGPDSVKAEVTARKNLVTWDKAYAQTVMDRIVQGT